MKKGCIRYLLLPLVLVIGLGVFCATAHAQDELHLKLIRSVYLRKTNITTFEDAYIHFPNINRIGKYSNKLLVKKIQAAEKAHNYPQLNELLTEYVSNFGIENFKFVQDLDYLWRLGQVREILQDTLGAMFCYSLAIKNQYREWNQIKLHYDELRNQTKVEYVNLEYYYKIVAARLEIDTLAPPQGVLLSMADDKINTRFAEYGPHMHPSKQSLVFTSKRGPFEPSDMFDPEINEDLYYTEIEKATGTWSFAQRFPDDVINTVYNEGSGCLDSTGDVLIFVRCEAPDGMGLCDIYQSEFLNGQWSKAKNLGDKVNSAYWDSHPNLSPDGKRLYFASNRPGGFGRTDLYYCDLQANGDWGPAQNLGPIVNTIEDEVTPFQHPILNTLYFSSTGHLHNMGGFDIFRTRWLGDHWEEPRNVGPLVNTEQDEYYFSIDFQADTLFYAKSNAKNKKDMDLYSFPMPMGARPDAVVKLNGYLIDSVSNQPLTGIVVAVDLDKNVEIEPIYINKYGYFEFNLINNRNYALMIVGDNAIRIAATTPLTADTVSSMLRNSVELDKPIVFEAVQFQPNSAAIPKTLETNLAFIGQFLKAHPFCKIIIRGHTDSDGPDDYNLKLSEDRAMNIKSFLISNFELKDTAILAEGYGETRPIYPNDNAENKLHNRRVEFEIIVPDEYKLMLKKSGIVVEKPFLEFKSPDDILFVDSLFIGKGPFARDTVPGIDSTGVEPNDLNFDFLTSADPDDIFGGFGTSLSGGFEPNPAGGTVGVGLDDPFGSPLTNPFAIGLPTNIDIKPDPKGLNKEPGTGPGSKPEAPKISDLKLTDPLPDMFTDDGPGAVATPNPDASIDFNLNLDGLGFDPDAFGTGLPDLDFKGMEDFLDPGELSLPNFFEF